LLGVNTTTDNKYVAENSEFLLFAVKPQSFPEVAASIKGVCPEKVITIMAGVKKAYIKNSLGVGLIKVARCMPNLPCSIGSGMMGIDMSDFNSNVDDTDFITNLFDNMGQVLSISEDKLDAVTGISGSGPAYVFMFIDSLIDAGVKQGLTRDEAKTLAVQTVIGGAEMVQHEQQKTLPELILSVCSKGGTTIEAVKVFENNNFSDIISDAVDACVKRSKELSER
jgi:pyrroline-5-carboxylate reductase